MQVLATKLYRPPLRPQLISRLRLVQRLEKSRAGKLTLISAPAGFGKTTLLSEWLAGCGCQAAWVSLDAEDSDPARFLLYLVAALQTVDPQLGKGMMGRLVSPQPPPVESVLTAILNEINTVQDPFVLVLDDYHAISSQQVDDALAFLVEHLPPKMHLVISTREDPPLLLARLRARDQITELRTPDLRFTLDEASQFLNQVMGLKLSSKEIAALETRTEGWIAGLQLAALAIQGSLNTQPTPQARQKDLSSFLDEFLTSHHFIIDYLLEEVLKQQKESVQTFLLLTSILDRMCGALCDAVLQNTGAQEMDGQRTLESLQRANLFIVPLDNERRWYRYHHLFADMLRQRLQSYFRPSSSSPENVEALVSALHIRASQWYEDNGLALEAFQHAAAAKDIDRANRLIDGKGIPLHFVSPVSIILNWLATVPKEELDARPVLWWRYASLLLIAGRTDGVEEKLQAAEAALAAQGISVESNPSDPAIRSLFGLIAAARATLALTRYDAATMLAQSRLALAYLDSQRKSMRATALWTLGGAHLFLGDRRAARQALMESIALSQASGAVFTLILAIIPLGNVQELDLELHQAAETYRQILELAGDPPQQIIHEAHLGLARILYEWNDLEAAERHGLQSLQLARQYDVRVIDRFVMCEVFLARLKLAQGDTTGAAALLAQTEQAARERKFTLRLPEVAAAQVLVFLRQGQAAAAAQTAQRFDLPLSQARVKLGRDEGRHALELIQSYLEKVEAMGWQDERLKGLLLQSLAFQATGETELALAALEKALTLSEPAGCVRMFLDEGSAMEQLLLKAAGRGILPGYMARLLAAFQDLKRKPAGQLPDMLSPRELEVLQLIAQGYSNQEISERLFLALDTVKGHTRRIFEKLQVKRRTEAVARGRELGLLP
jgi:LuxR family transcriptional regulator, maltose regulon positive regulatory protein